MWKEILEQPAVLERYLKNNDTVYRIVEKYLIQISDLL